MGRKKSYRGNIAFFYRNSWYHRKKELLEDGRIKYGRIGGFETPEEAEQSYYECLKIFEEQSRNYFAPIINTEIMLKDYLIYWFENVYSTKIESSTKMITSFALYELILPNIQYDIKLRLVTIDYLDTLLKRISPSCKSAGNKARETLFLAFKDAVSDNYITVNPVASTKQYRRPKTKVTILNQEELKEFLELASKGNWYLEILLALFCGLRKGEVLGLKFDDFNPNKRTVRISRQLAFKYTMKEKQFVIDKMELEERDPKTENAFRTLRIPEVVSKELEKRRLLIDYNKNNNDNYNDNDYISCQSNGKPHCLTAVNNYTTKLCKRNGLRKITVHGLRHQFATILIEQNVSLAKISALLGHASIHTTFDFYCDVMGEKAKIMAFMNNTFAVEEEYDEV